VRDRGRWTSEEGSINHHSAPICPSTAPSATVGLGPSGLGLSALGNWRLREGSLANPSALAARAKALIETPTLVQNDRCFYQISEVVLEMRTSVP
jgi:hypothetical protein